MRFIVDGRAVGGAACNGIVASVAEPSPSRTVTPFSHARGDGHDTATRPLPVPLPAHGWELPAWPAYGLQSDVRPALAEAVSQGRAAVLATLFSSDGPTPLGPGAQMLFDGGAAAGFLSGGCVEGDVAVHARVVLGDGVPRRLVYGRGGPIDLPLLCGSRIEVLVERIAPDDEAAQALLTLAAARRPALWLSDGEIRTCVAEAASSHVVPPALRPAFAEALKGASPAGSAGGGAFRRHQPAARLVVVGRDPIALAIGRLAAQAGYETTMIRPLGPEAPPPVPSTAYLRTTPDDAFGSLDLDPWTAVVVATHEIDLDHSALTAALPTEAFFVGAIGSRRRLPERRRRLAADGVSPEAIDRLHAPLGLAIGARSPWEIAISVLAEIIQASRSRDARRPGPGAP